MSVNRWSKSPKVRPGQIANFCDSLTADFLIFGCPSVTDMASEQAGPHILEEDGVVAAPDEDQVTSTLTLI